MSARRHNGRLRAARAADEAARDAKRLDRLAPTRAAIDAALLEFRQAPTQDTFAALMATQRVHVDAFHGEQAAEFIDRTR